MHNSKQDFDRFYYSSAPKGRSSSITVPPHGIIPAVYSIETGEAYNQEFPEEQSTVHKTVKMTFVLTLLTVLLVGFVFAILSVTRLSRV
uniref:Uncharacterized protein n=1 Tax=Caenorhabditis japonica TaxID=281687 RepID=A0A8R1I1K8_CAEJA